MYLLVEKQSVYKMVLILTMYFEWSVLANVSYNSNINTTNVSKFFNHTNFRKESFQTTVPRYGFNQAMNRSHKKM